MNIPLQILILPNSFKINFARITTSNRAYCKILKWLFWKIFQNFQKENQQYCPFSVKFQLQGHSFTVKGFHYDWFSANFMEFFRTVFFVNLLFWLLLLTYFMSLISFYSSWKHGKSRGFLMYSGSIRRDHPANT